ncbi:hypothetical protein SEUCBS139899_001862 [Sporothrix eucalyptigena]
MSSRFVSGGTIGATTGEAVKVKTESAPAKPLTSTTSTTTATPAAAPAASTSPPPITTARQAEWAAVEKELEAERQRKAEARKALAGAPEKSLYDVLQANKAAKQAAFEEQNKFKNQFRALDEDEIEFLDGIEADARAAEARVKAETAAGLDAFRAAQGKREAKGDGEDGTKDDDETAELVGDTAWAVGRKRKRKTDNKTAFPNVKRKGSSTEQEEKADEEEMKEKTSQKEVETKSTTPLKDKAATAPPPKARPVLGLGDYGSDDDSD